jgi:phage tail P2-like protein
VYGCTFPPDGQATCASLLPPNATAVERAIEQPIAVRLAAMASPLRSLWGPVEDIPAAYLPTIAWGLGVDEWDPALSVARQREIVASALDLNRRRGTVGSVRIALADAGFGAVEIEEGVMSWRYGDPVSYGDPGLTYSSVDAWAQYRITFVRPLSPAQAETVRRILDRTAPARCHLYAISYAVAPWTYGDPTAHYGDALTYL